MDNQSFENSDNTTNRGNSYKKILLVIIPILIIIILTGCIFVLNAYTRSRIITDLVTQSQQDTAINQENQAKISKLQIIESNKPKTIDKNNNSIKEEKLNNTINKTKNQEKTVEENIFRTPELPNFSFEIPDGWNIDTEDRKMESEDGKAKIITKNITVQKGRNKINFFFTSHSEGPYLNKCMDKKTFEEKVVVQTESYDILDGDQYQPEYYLTNNENAKFKEEDGFESMIKEALINVNTDNIEYYYCTGKEVFYTEHTEFDYKIALFISMEHNPILSDDTMQIINSIKL